MARAGSLIQLSLRADRAKETALSAMVPANPISAEQQPAQSLADGAAAGLAEAEDGIGAFEPVLLRQFGDEGVDRRPEPRPGEPENEIAETKRRDDDCRVRRDEEGQQHQRDDSGADEIGA